MTTSRPREVAVRAWAAPDYLASTSHREPTSIDPSDEPSKQPKPPSVRDLGPSAWSLIFDTETMPQLGQPLRLITWQVRQHGQLKEAGIGYDPAQLSDAELATVQTFAADRQMQLFTRAEFVEQVFMPLMWNLRATVIGFNLPFDLSRLAIGHAAARTHGRNWSMRGGFSFELSTDPRWPRIQIKRINPRAAFIRCTAPDGNHAAARNRRRGGNVTNHRGYFIDTSTLASALVGGKPNLARLAELLDTTTRKKDGNHAGPVTAEYLHYACADVQVTWECYEKLRDRWDSYQLTRTPLWQIYSEASLGKAHLRQLGVQPWRVVQPDAPHWLIAAELESYYGGRTEPRVRRVAVPVVITDLTSEYPTGYVLQNLWRYQIADGYDWHDEHPALITRQLNDISTKALLDPSFWPQLTRLVLIAPDNDLLPTRAEYAGTGVFNVALSNRQAGPPQWYTYADAIVSALTTGHPPTILRALTFKPGPAQDRLESIALTGDPRFTIDPYKDDLVRAGVELRAQLKTDKNTAYARGDVDSAQRLDAAQQVLKTPTNAVGYGIGIEANPVDHATKQPVTVCLPDGDSYRTSARRTEEPGTYFHPLIATLVAASGRLQLALVMQLVAERAGQWVYCDTDSVHIAASPIGGLLPCIDGTDETSDGEAAIRLLSWADVDGIVDQLRELNPYQGLLTGQSLLKIEDENYDPETKQQWQIWDWVIASKRYAPFRFDRMGRPVLVRKHNTMQNSRSEHGLGHLYPPIPRADRDRGVDWIDEWWLHLLNVELGFPSNPPAWFNYPAVGRLTVNNRRSEALFDTFNRNRPYPQQVRPMNFGMTVTAARGQPGTTRPVLVAPLEDNPDRWCEQEWHNRHDSGSTTVEIRTTDSDYSIPGTTPVLTYGDYFDEYRRHPEAKAAGPDGQPCTPTTYGLLHPLTVTPDRLLRVGKEAGRLIDTQVAPDPHDRVEVYAERQCRGCDTPLAGRRQWCSEACRKRSSRRGR